MLQLKKSMRHCAGSWRENSRANRRLRRPPAHPTALPLAAPPVSHQKTGVGMPIKDSDGMQKSAVKKSKGKRRTLPKAKHELINPVTAVVEQKKVDDAFVAANPEPPLVEGDQFAKRRKAQFERAARNHQFRFKVLSSYQIPIEHARCVEDVFLTLVEAAQIRKRIVAKLSDVWWF